MLRTNYFKQVINIDQFQSYEDFLANDSHVNISEVDFYKQVYKSTYDLLESKIQVI